MTHGQHYYPASLIGQFSKEEGGIRRNRRVNIVRRKPPKILINQRAQNGGFFGKPHLDIYDSQGLLDDLWQSIEPLIEPLWDSLRKASRDQFVPREDVVKLWAPYVAHLFARSPRITLNEVDDLRNGGNHYDRRDLFAQFAAILSTHAQWSIIRSSVVDLVSNDGGFARLPSDDPLSDVMYVPLHRSLGLLVRVHNILPSETALTKLRVPCFTWKDADVLVLNDLVTLLAGSEVYCSEQHLAIAAHDLMQGNRPVHHLPSGANAEPLVSAAIELSMFMLIDGAAPPFTDPWAAYISTLHLYACDCAQRFSHGEPCPADADPETARRYGRARWDINARRWAPLFLPQKVKVSKASVYAGNGKIVFVTDRGFHLADLIPSEDMHFFRHQGPPQLTT